MNQRGELQSQYVGKQYFIFDNFKVDDFFKNVGNIADHIFQEYVGWTGVDEKSVGVTPGFNKSVIPSLSPEDRSSGNVEDEKMNKIAQDPIPKDLVSFYLDFMILYHLHKVVSKEKTFLTYKNQYSIYKVFVNCGNTEVSLADDINGSMQNHFNEFAAYHNKIKVEKDWRKEIEECINQCLLPLMRERD
jgi:hypothetical protein